jgi:hypothetical protein
MERADAQHFHFCGQEGFWGLKGEKGFNFSSAFFQADGFYIIGVFLFLRDSA